MIPPFAIVPYPAPHEHAAGFHRRLAALNMFDSFRHMRVLHGVESLLPTSGEDAWTRISNATGLPRDRLASLRWAAMGSRYDPWLQIHGRSVRPHHVDLDHLRFCPQCVADDGTTWSYFTLHHVTACPKHGNRLLDGCYACGWKLRPDERTAVWNCGSCGADLRSAPPVPAGADEIALSRTLINAFCGHSLDEPGLPRRFTALDVGAMAGVTDRLATLIRLAAHDKPVRSPRLSYGQGGRPSRKDVAADAIDARTVHAMLADWPHAYHALLETLVDRNPDIAVGKGLARRFATKAGLLALRPLTGGDGEEVGLLRDATDAFLSERLGHVRGAPTPGAAKAYGGSRTIAPRPKRPISHEAAMLRLEGKPRRQAAAAWIRTGHFSEHHTTGGRVLLSEDDVEAVEQMLRAFEIIKPVNGLLTPDDVERIVGAGHGYTKTEFLGDLLSGKIEAFRTTETIDRPGLSALLFDPVDFETCAAVSRLASWIRQGAYKPLSRFTPSAVRIWSTMGLYDAVFCDQLIAAGKLRFRHYTPPGRSGRPTRHYHVGDLVRESQASTMPNPLDVDALEAETMKPMPALFRANYIP